MVYPLSVLSQVVILHFNACPLLTWMETMWNYAHLPSRPAFFDKMKYYREGIARMETCAHNLPPQPTPP